MTKNILSEIENIDTIKMAKEIFNEGEIYLVGGAIRDMLSNKTPFDYDFATPLNPEMVEKRTRDAGYIPLNIGEKYGTIKILIPQTKDIIDVTTFRGETYRNGSRKPDVTYKENIVEDLSRRDFTINAIAADMDGNIIDPFGGQQDIKNKMIKSVGNPEKRFEEDPLRMIRAFRFAITLNYNIESDTIETLKDMKRKILSVSRERWQIEMDKLLKDISLNNMSTITKTFFKTSIGAVILPEVSALQYIKQEGTHHMGEDALTHTLRTVAYSPKHIILRWAALLHDIGKLGTKNIETLDKDKKVAHFYGHEKLGAIMVDGIANRLTFSNIRRDTIKLLIKNHMRPSLIIRQNYGKRAIRRLASQTQPRTDYLIDLAIADVRGHKHGLEKDIKLLEKLRDEIKSVGMPSGVTLPSGLGDAIMEELELKEGPKIGEKIDMVEQAIIDGDLPNSVSVEDAISYIKGERR